VGKYLRIVMLRDERELTREKMGVEGAGHSLLDVSFRTFLLATGRYLNTKDLLALLSLLILFFTLN